MGGGSYEIRIGNHIQRQYNMIDNVLSIQNFKKIVKKLPFKERKTFFTRIFLITYKMADAPRTGKISALSSIDIVLNTTCMFYLAHTPSIVLIILYCKCFKKVLLSISF